MSNEFKREYKKHICINGINEFSNLMSGFVNDTKEPPFLKRCWQCGRTLVLSKKTKKQYNDYTNKHVPTDIIEVI